MKVLVLGASGMLGSAMIRVLSEKDDWKVFGTIRSGEIKNFFPVRIADRLVTCCDVTNYNDLVKVFKQINPAVVINCISLSKQRLATADPLSMIPVYALLPHQIAKLCNDIGARLVHISTDGVFSGATGGYSEEDPSDAKDLYGVTKYIGEVHAPHTISIRTSIIGHELQSSNGLLNWFFSQEKSCECFNRAIFSGLPTVVLAQIIRDIVIPRLDLYGVYHIAANPISKCNLLRLIADVYGKSIEIIPNDKVEIDRSLNAERFQLATGYVPPDWRQLIELMYSYQLNISGLIDNV